MAQWVISHLPLLQIPETGVVKPSLISGITTKYSKPETIYTLDATLPLPAFVTSGGFEGTTGHINALNHIQEYRWLSKLSWPIILLLEPDTYIQTTKKRDPLLSQQERALLWTASGLIEHVVLLPEIPKNIEVDEHYRKIGELFASSSWFTSQDNLKHLEIMMRPGKSYLNIGLDIPLSITPHMSYLYTTKDLPFSLLQTSLSHELVKLLQQANHTDPTLEGLLPWLVHHHYEALTQLIPKRHS